MASPETSTGTSPVKSEENGAHYNEKEPEDRVTNSPTRVEDLSLGTNRNGKGVADVDSEEDDDEEDEENGSGDEDEEDEEEEDEPSLKYERITGAIPDLLKKDSASALCVSNKLMAMGTHAGIIHVLDLSGKRIKSYKPHVASIIDISLDVTADFVASASIDGQVVVHSLSTPENYSFDMKRPMRTVAMEPNFAKRSTRAFVCGGLSGALVMREKGWLGHKETTLHQGEGPIWQVKWRGRLIAWANDQGVKIYDQVSQARIAYIDRPADSPRADLFKCTLHWQDDSTLLIAWANFIKVARIRTRPRGNNATNIPNAPPLLVEVTAVFQLDCMVAGIVPHPTPVLGSPMMAHSLPATLNLDLPKPAQPQTLTSFLILAYTPPEAFDDTNEMTDDRMRQARKAAERPEMRIISRAGEELAVDALSIADYRLWGCNDYTVAEVASSDDPLGLAGDVDRSYVVMSPRDLVRVMPRDRRDHVGWLVEKERYEEALMEVEKIEAEEAATGVKPSSTGDARVHLSSQDIGQKFIEHLFLEGDFVRAAQLCPKVCAHDVKRWENWIFRFAERRQLQAIIPYVPKENPRLDHVIYEMMLAHFLTHDRTALLHTIKDWPRDIYDIAAVIIAVRAELDKTASTSSTMSTNGDSTVLMECLAELYTANRQPGKALPFYLRLRRSNVFDLIRDNNLFTDVQDQVLLLVEFDHELMEKRKKSSKNSENVQSDAIKLLVDNIHSIPITRVVQQLRQRPYYLFLYLDSLVRMDSQLVAGFADLQVKMYAEFATSRLIDFLRASSSYNLELAYKECQERDLVPEMVFLLGRMGNNKKALTLIIERLGDVHRAIDFAKEQSDDDLWEDLLKYSETRPAFIRGLLENVGVEISPIRLIRRIKNGLEIPGLKEALIKILQDFHLQISLLEGCQTILNGDSSDLSRKLQHNQSSGFFLSSTSKCHVCGRPLADTPNALVLLFLCRHVVHATCVSGTEHIPLPTPDPFMSSLDGSGDASRGITGSIAYDSMIKARLAHGCPVCHKNGEGQ
ncbi:hypothetical protein GALMADRAFT_237137 [Galerina marginata CBS 339.88]|uniref:Vacuolar protein sorting-associated protein 41 n=1 Tax=Galerina marginata (strain CBS 339.88) TaxID=685588 RepID=A0A067TZ44_GALM3|nr:hypothetical protein GALMADRAFT_237137 [Galerina marginata CBS 339.88]